MQEKLRKKKSTKDNEQFCARFFHTNNVKVKGSLVKEHFTKQNQLEAKLFFRIAMS